MKRILRELAVFALFAALAVILSWPLARTLDSAVSDLGDPLLNAWILKWVVHSFTTAPLQVFDAPIFHPAKYPLAYSENLFGIAILMLPFHLAGLPPLTLYNVAVLFGLTLSGYGAYVLARTFTGRMVPSLIAGIFFGFLAYRWDHLPHLQIIWSGWIPLMFAALVAYFKKPGNGRAALIFLTFVMNGLTNVHWFLFGSFTLALTVVLFFVFGPRRDKRFWIRIVVALLLGGVVMLPVLLPYRTVSHLYQMKRSLGEAEWGSATWSDWLVAAARNALYGDVQREEMRHAERVLFPGLLTIFLTACAFFLRRRDTHHPPRHPASPKHNRWLRTLDVLIVICGIAAWIGVVTQKFKWEIGDVRILSLDNAGRATMFMVLLTVIRFAIRYPLALGGAEGKSLRDTIANSRFTLPEIAAALWIAVGILGSFGVNGFFHTYLYREFDVFRSLRVPARWAMIGYMGLAVWMALGARELIERRRQWHRSALATLLILFAVAEAVPQIRWEHALAKPTPLHRWLATARPGPLLELPIQNYGVQYHYVLGAAHHHNPIMNGTSGFDPPLYQRLAGKTERYEYDDELTTLLEQNGCAYVVVHTDWLADDLDPTIAWLRRDLGTGRLAFVRRFDHLVHGDYVFAVTRNARDWARHRAPDLPDAAGHLPAQNLERMLNKQPTYNNSTFGYVAAPRPHNEVTRELRVTGWALSPHGVRRVTVLVHNQSRRYEAQLIPDQNISTRWPWYPETPRPGFLAVIPKRPKGIPRDTDLQIEVEDGAGRVTRFSDILLRWN